MYFPPYEQILKVIKNAGTSIDDSGQVTLSKDLFNFILQAALVTSDFDEDAYLTANPDVRRQIASSNGLTANQHFIGFGYFEGRKGGLPKVDEFWYLETYPDVAVAVANGQIGSAKEHFEVIGAMEGRAPSVDYLDVARQWKFLLKR